RRGSLPAADRRRRPAGAGDRPMSERLPGTADVPPLPPHLGQVCARFEAAWRQAGTAGPAPRVEDYLGDAAGPERAALLRPLLAPDIPPRPRRGEAPPPQDYRDRFPALDAAWLTGELTAPVLPPPVAPVPAPAAPAAVGAAETPTPAPAAGRLRCPHCDN